MGAAVDGEVHMVDGVGEVGTVVGAGGMVSSAVDAGEVDMVDRDRAGEVAGGARGSRSRKSCWIVASVEACKSAYL